MTATLAARHVGTCLSDAELLSLIAALGGSLRLLGMRAERAQRAYLAGLETEAFVRRLDIDEPRWEAFRGH